MDVAQLYTLTASLTAAERGQVERAAAAAGKTVDDFVRDAVLAAADDPFLAALEQAVDTVTRDVDRARHDYAGG